ncbi:MAG: hypothetical protein M3P18_05375 [Actinomycetota bacterium]|nr:hypothetical protein [Actinomycetota bacterium]
MLLLAAMCCDRSGRPRHEFGSHSTSEQVAGAVFIFVVIALILLLMKMDWRRQDEEERAGRDPHVPNH